jgi:hypothetical protein
MSYDQHEIEYHLTPSGWVVGTTSYGTDKIERPPETVETWLKKVEHSSGYAMEDIGWDLLWVSESVSHEERAALNVKFEHPRVKADEINARVWKPQKKRKRQPIE